MAERYSRVAENIMSHDLEISAEMDTETRVGEGAMILLSGEIDGTAFLQLSEEWANENFHFEFRTSTSCCSWCFTISIGNEQRSGGTCVTTYWITPVQHEAANAKSAPMPLAMPCLVPRHGGGFVAHLALGQGASEQLKRTALPYYNIGTEGTRLLRWPCYPHLRLDEWRTNQPSLTEHSSEGQPAYTASEEDGTTGKDHLVKTP
ncbi:hypothetical protein FEM48_ZijujUnG0013300 [Ziziphus jujuba var. spinosa]|uniref:Uncharacterized protein n=1 Tax=Ziziphus jujuba var. spinosa TaxID=714518 RepID=A0A978U9X5_ZIZJJ|nr:hypothetical protein FEM48_ZijujUnG0013300 [Ziziphus jujuba var. spinosa]